MRLTIKRAIIIVAAVALSLIAIRLGFYARRDAAPTSPGISPTPGGTPVVMATPSRAMPNAIPNDTRIVINAPAYRMDIFENGNLMQSYRIGIGYPEFPLPAGMRTANEIIFNPAWTALAGQGYYAAVGLDTGRKRPRAVAVNSRNKAIEPD